MIAKHYLFILKRKLKEANGEPISINMGKLSDLQLNYFRKSLPDYEIERDYLWFYKFTKKQ